MEQSIEQSIEHSIEHSMEKSHLPAGPDLASVRPYQPTYQSLQLVAPYQSLPVTLNILVITTRRSRFVVTGPACRARLRSSSPASPERGVVRSEHAAGLTAEGDMGPDPTGAASGKRLDEAPP